MRLQLALNVRDLDEAVRFYSRLFATEPAKTRPGYANFAIDEPPLKLVLFEAPDADDRLNHLGVEVFSDREVLAAQQRFAGSDLPIRYEGETDCCHARQHKVWTQEPQGLAWEWYRVIDDEPDPAGTSRERGACCVQ